MASAELLVRLIMGPPAQLLYTGSFRDVQSDWNIVYGIDPYSRRVTCGGGKRDRIFPVIGDSFVFGQGVSDCSDFVSQLNQHINEVQFQNFGLIGTGPEEYLMVARDLVPKNSDGVLVVFYGNDISELSLDRSLFGVVADNSSFFGLLRRIWRSWRVREALTQEVTQNGPPAPFNNIKAVLAKDADYFRRVVEPEAEKKAYFERHFNRLVENLESKIDRSRIYIAVVPDATIVSDAVREFVLQNGGEVAQKDKAGSGYEFIRNLSVRAGVNFIETFALLKYEGVPLYYPHDLHWTAQGHRRFAEIVGSALTQERR